MSFALVKEILGPLVERRGGRGGGSEEIEGGKRTRDKMKKNNGEISTREDFGAPPWLALTMLSFHLTTQHS